MGVLATTPLSMTMQKTNMYVQLEKGMKLHRYRSSKCQGCTVKTQCTPSKQRRGRRWEHEAILEEMQIRLSNAPDMTRIRKRTIEHPFGTLKHGWARRIF